MPNFKEATVADGPEYTTCSVCNRVVERGHVNSSGRCVDCAGKPAADAGAANTDEGDPREVRANDPKRTARGAKEAAAKDTAEHAKGDPRVRDEMVDGAAGRE